MNMQRFLILFVVFAAALAAGAQTEKVDALMAQAKEYTRQGEFLKSNECHEQVLAELDALGIDGLEQVVKDCMALNLIHLGSPMLRAGQYVEAEPHLTKAVELTRPDTKVGRAARSRMGQCHGGRSLQLQVGNADLPQALALSLKAEECFRVADERAYLLSQQISTAALLNALSRGDEAVALLQAVVAACGDEASLRLQRGRALARLGNIEMDNEDFRAALAHLEEAYDLCIEAGGRAQATVAALCLYRLYSYGIRNAQLAETWRQRAEELKGNNQSKNE